MGRSDCCYEIEISMEEGRVEIKCVTFGFDETRGELSVREMTCVQFRFPYLYWTLFLQVRRRRRRSKIIYGMTRLPSRLLQYTEFVPDEFTGRPLHKLPSGIVRIRVHVAACANCQQFKLIAGPLC